MGADRSRQFVVDRIWGAPPGDGARERSQSVQVLRELAQHLDVPVLLLVELGLSLDARADKRPVAQDLAEAGMLEREADAVFYLHRPGMYEKSRRTKGVVEMNVARHSTCALGTVRLTFVVEETRFLDPRDQPGDVTLN